MFTLKKFQQQLAHLTDSQKFLVAYSGGMDSHLLLYCLTKIKTVETHSNASPNHASPDKIKVRAVHVHHNLSPNADMWVQHCQKECAKLGVELLVQYVDARLQTESKHSPESIARELRYQALSDLLQPDECLVTAHHADDQAETMLLQMFRGAGVKGLAAMPGIKGFGKSTQARPLLSFTRQGLHAYAVQESLRWIEDESNENIGFDRNYVRHKLLPEILERWPSAFKTIGRSADNCAEAIELIEILAAQDLENVQGSKPNTLAISKLLKLDDARQKNVLRFWLEKLNFSLPSKKKLQHIQRDVLNCRQDAMPLVAWQDVEIRRFRDDLYAMPPLESFDANAKLVWDGESVLLLPGNLGVLKPELLVEHNITINQGDKLHVCFRSAITGAKCKKKMQELDVPPWMRDRVPILCCDDQLIFLI